MTWVAVAVAGATLVSGAMGSSASKKAAKSQEALSREALAEERRQFDTTQQNLQPWLQAGQAGLGRMRDLMGIGGTTMTPEQVMEMSPGYQFRLGEGNKAINNAAGSRGMLNSGATLKALTRFGQDYASNEYNNIFNRLAGISGTGMNTGTALGSLGAGSSGRIGDLMTGIGNARGASAIGSANAWTNALNTGVNAYGQYNMMNRLFPQNTGSSWMSTGSSTPYAGSYGGGNV